MYDGFGRKIEVLRISVTDRCNYRCTYCMPESGVVSIPHEQILRYEEITEVVKEAVKLDITRFRLTGGEPLVRPGIISLVSMIRAIPDVEELALTTNGSLLAPLAEQLKTAGLDRVNISLDTLDPQRFKQITRGGKIDDVLKGIDAAFDAGLLPVKLNIVTFASESEKDAEMVEEFARKRGCVSRRINKMDLQNGVFDVVENSDRGDCKRCNRLRLTSNGYVRCCLLHDRMFNIRTLGIRNALIQAIQNKPERGIGTSCKGMNLIGG